MCDRWNHTSNHHPTTGMCQTAFDIVDGYSALFPVPVAVAGLIEGQQPVVEEDSVWYVTFHGGSGINNIYSYPDTGGDPTSTSVLEQSEGITGRSPRCAPEAEGPRSQPTGARNEAPPSEEAGRLDPTVSGMAVGANGNFYAANRKGCEVYEYDIATGNQVGGPVLSELPDYPEFLLYVPD